MNFRGTMAKLRRGMTEQRAACEHRLAQSICDPSSLPPLAGNEGEVRKAEALREKTVALMALRRAAPEREMAMLELIRAYTDAAWWTDAFCASGSAAGIRRLLNRQAARTLGEGEFAQDAQERQPPDVRYFVDGENVSPNQAFVQEILQKPDAHLVLFVSDHCQWPKESDAKNKQLLVNATVERVNCETGTKNAMDFQIVGVVGEYLAKYPDGAAYIVSNDTGYDAAINMWLSKGFSVGRIGKPAASEQAGEKAGNSAPKFDRKALKRIAETSLQWNGYQEDEKSRLADILVQFALGEFQPPYANDVHAAIGHHMKCGNRYAMMYAAERKNIEAFLALAKYVALSACRE